MSATLPPILWVASAVLVGVSLLLLVLGIVLTNRTKWAELPRDLGLAILSGVVVTFGFTVTTIEVDDRRATRDATRAEAVAMREAIRTNPDLRGLQAQGVQLRYTYALDRDFTDADLSFADLGWSTLTGGNFSDANLWATDFSQANVTGANFTGARLEATDFSGADLRGSDFRQADFERTVLSFADLRGADLSGTRLDSVVWEDEYVGLSGACYDSATIWPRGFQAPPELSGCR